MVLATVLTVVGAAARSGVIDALLLVAYALLLVSLTVAFRARRARRAPPADPPRMDERSAARIAAFAPPATRSVAPPTRVRPRPAPETRPSPVLPPPAAQTRPSPVPETRPSPAATRPSPIPPAAPPTAQSPQQEAALETCEIVWWRGFVKSQFFAVATTGGDDIERVAESPLFRWRRAEPPEPVEEPLSAHRTLVAILEADGWVRSGDGDAWYSLRYRRPRSPAAASA